MTLLTPAQVRLRAGSDVAQACSPLLRQQAKYCRKLPTEPKNGGTQLLSDPSSCTFTSDMYQTLNGLAKRKGGAFAPGMPTENGDCLAKCIAPRAWRWHHLFFIVGANTLSTMQGVINSVAPPEGWFSTLVKHSFRDAGRAVTEAHSPNHPPKRTPGGQAASWMRLLSAAELPTTLHNNSRRHWVTKYGLANYRAPTCDIGS